MCGLTRQCASSAQSDGLAARADGHGDRAFDRLDDVGEADLSRRPREREPAARAADAGEEASIASWPMSFWAVGSGTPVSAESSVALRRAPAGRRAAAVIKTTA